MRQPPLHSPQTQILVIPKLGSRKSGFAVSVGGVGAQLEYFFYLSPCANPPPLHKFLEQIPTNPFKNPSFWMIFEGICGYLCIEILQKSLVLGGLLHPSSSRSTIERPAKKIRKIRVCGECRGVGARTRYKRVGARLEYFFHLGQRANPPTLTANANFRDP